MLWYAVFPFVYWVTPAGVFDTDYGIYLVDTQAEAFLEWSFLLIAFALWWRLAPALVRPSPRSTGTCSPRSRDQLEKRVAHVAQTRAESVDSRRPSCAGSNATCTTARRRGWWRSA